MKHLHLFEEFEETNEDNFADLHDEGFKPNSLKLSASW